MAGPFYCMSRNCSYCSVRKSALYEDMQPDFACCCKLWGRSIFSMHECDGKPILHNNRRQPFGCRLYISAMMYLCVLEALYASFWSLGKWLVHYFISGYNGVCRNASVKFFYIAAH